MLHPSTRRLIEKLDEMTRKQRVAWDESEDGSVTHDTEGYRVTLSPEPHAMRLTDALGREIETCSPQDFTGESDASGRPFAEFVADLFREAHRHARGAEKAISVLLSSLDEAEAVEMPAEAEPELESFDHAEDAGDDSRPLEDHELPEIDDDENVKEAVVAMADEVNRPVEAPAPVDATPEPEAEQAAVTEPEPVAAAVFEPEPVPEPQTEPEPAAFEPETIPEPVVGAAPKEPAPAAPEAPAYAPFTGSTEDAQAYATAAVFEAPAPAEPQEPVAAEPEMPAPASELEAPAVESEAFAAGNDVWDAISGAGPEQGEAPLELDSAPVEPEAPEAVAQPEVPAQAEAPAPETPAPTTTSNFFTGGLGDLSRYRTEQPAAPAPEPVAEAAPAPAEPEIQPEPEPEPAPAPPPQRFSLSGITSGFGLGSTQPAARPQPAAEPAPEAPAEPQPEKVVIDGTADLPDVMPESTPDAGYRMEEDQEFDFTDADLVPGVAAAPMPAAAEPAEATSTPTQEDSAPEAESAETDAEPPRRFNPWN